MNAYTLTTVLIRVVAFFALLISIIQTVASFILFSRVASMTLSDSMQGQMLSTIFVVPIAAFIISLILLLLSRPIASLLTRDLS